MARVSLKEAYDNKDVVAQIYAIRDIAEGASDTADNAVTTANDAKTYVDTLGVQVEGAVQTANNASASAQESAETVAQYDTRLTNVEGDLNAVTLRVTTAEGNIVTIQGRVTALETADGQNVKLTGEHAIGNYALLLTGTQVKTSGKLIVVVPNYDYSLSIRDTSDITNITSQRVHSFPLVDANGVIICGLRFVIQTNGEVLLQAEMRKNDGTYKYITLATNA